MVCLEDPDPLRILSGLLPLLCQKSRIPGGHNAALEAAVAQVAVSLSVQSFKGPAQEVQQKGEEKTSKAWQGYQTP